MFVVVEFYEQQKHLISNGASPLEIEKKVWNTFGNIYYVRGLLTATTVGVAD
jgi:hypothetical protein